MKLGEERIKKEICVERECYECGEPAQWKHTYLLEGSRRNPASRAYGRDDCSWSEDDCKFACDEHKELVRKDYPNGMSWCSTFDRKVFEHLFLYWKEIKS
jgi:hypothetical protein